MRSSFQNRGFTSPHQRHLKNQMTQQHVANNIDPEKSGYLSGHLSQDNPYRDKAGPTKEASEAALAWERQNGKLQGSSQSPEAASQDRASLAEANPEGFYASMVRQQFQDWMDRYMPRQQEAINMAMGNDRRDQAMQLGREHYVSESGLRPGTIGIGGLNHRRANEQFLSTGQGLLAGQERQGIADTTANAFKIGEGINQRRNERYGLNIEPSESQTRNRELNQALTTTGGVNNMRTNLRDRQEALMTGTASSMNNVLNSISG